MPTEQREMDIYRSLYLSRTLVRSTAYAIIYSFERGIEDHHHPRRWLGYRNKKKMGV
jgi:hypothetical protein